MNPNAPRSTPKQEALLPRFARLTTFRPSAARILGSAFCVLPALLLAAACGQQASAQQPSPYSYGFGYGAPSSPYGYQQPAPPQQYVQPQYQQPYAAPQPSPYQQASDQAYAPPQPYADQQQYAPAQAPLTPGELQQLLAPVSLYPDSLLAQILTASTYPGQVAVANQWLQQMQAQGYGASSQIAAAVASQNWDPSVQGLTAFPQVLAMMDQNLEWTTELGNAWFNQPQDVMQTVQVLRQRAQAAGTLQNTPQEPLTYAQDDGDQGDIELAPSNPDDVYVPNYNPWSAYGSPISPYPGFSLGGLFSSLLGTGMNFGSGIGMAAFNHTPFGLLGWSLSWLAQAIFFHHGTYFTNSTTVADWGFPHGGARAYAGWNRAGHWAGGYRGHDGRGFMPYRRADSGYRGGYSRPAPPQNWNRSAHPERGYANSYYGRNNHYGRSPQQALRQPTPQFSRPQPFNGFNRPESAYNRPNYAYGRPGYDNRAGQSFAPRSGYAYGGYRSPQSSYQRAYAGPPVRSFNGQERFSGQAHSGGFHLFGRGHESGNFRAPKNFYGGGKAPKGFGYQHTGHESFGHQHFGHQSFGHGGFGHAKAPKMHGGGGGHRHH